MNQYNIIQINITPHTYSMRFMGHDGDQKACTADADVREKKVQAVLALSQEADKALEPLAALSKDLVIDKMYEALARAVADHHLTSLDTELAKETGRNPTVMLACTQGLAKVWPDLGGAWECFYGVVFMGLRIMGYDISWWDLKSNDGT